MKNLGRYAKAVVGAVLAGLGPLYLALDDNVVTQKESIAVATAFFTALSLIWAVPNAKDSTSTTTAAGDDVQIDVEPGAVGERWYHEGG